MAAERIRGVRPTSARAWVAGGAGTQLACRVNGRGPSTVDSLTEGAPACSFDGLVTADGCALR
jgi:hypothetical protein